MNMLVFSVQEDLPERMGKALRSLTAQKPVDDRVYPTWDALVDRYVQIGHSN